MRGSLWESFPFKEGSWGLGHLEFSTHKNDPKTGPGAVGPWSGMGPKGGSPRHKKNSCFLIISSKNNNNKLCPGIDLTQFFLDHLFKHFVNVVGKSMGYTLRFCLLATCVLRWPNFIQIPPCEIPESKRYGFKWLLVMTWIHLPEPSNIVKFQPPRSVFGFFGG